MFHVVCHDCPHEFVADSREAAEGYVDAHRNREPDHDVEYDAIDGTVRCEDCGQSKPVEETESLVNVLTNERSFICQDCHRAGAIF